MIWPMWTLIILLTAYLLWWGTRKQHAPVLPVRLGWSSTGLCAKCGRALEFGVCKFCTNGECKCTDKGCPVHPGTVCDYAADGKVYRIDMTDLSGTRMCDGCIEDAMKAGIYDTHPLHEEEHA